MQERAARWSRLALVLASLAAACRSTEVTTTQYLAVFDPQQQVTQELYRVRIHGEAAWYSDTDFATGWVPSGVADLVENSFSPVRNENGGTGVSYSKSPDGKPPEPITRASRQFYEVGPAGVSTSPQDHRFVVVMGANPDQFFKKMGLLTTMGKDPDGASLNGRLTLALDLADDLAEIGEGLDEVAEARKALDEAGEGGE
jgi:hypothetical protein